MTDSPPVPLHKIGRNRRIETKARRDRELWIILHLSIRLNYMWSAFSFHHFTWHNACIPNEILVQDELYRHTYRFKFNTNQLLYGFRVWMAWSKHAGKLRGLKKARKHEPKASDFARFS